MEWPEADRFLEEIGPGARRELLRVLISPPDVRGDVIRQFFNHKSGGDMAELLMLLEERDWPRQAMVEAIQRFEATLPPSRAGDPVLRASCQRYRCRIDLYRN